MPSAPLGRAEAAALHRQSHNLQVTRATADLPFALSVSARVITELFFRQQKRPGIKPDLFLYIVQLACFSLILTKHIDFPGNYFGADF